MHTNFKVILSSIFDFLGSLNHSSPLRDPPDFQKMVRNVKIQRDFTLSIFSNVYRLLFSNCHLNEDDTIIQLQIN